MGSTTFSGPVTSTAGFISGADSIVSVTTATLTVTPELHAGRTLVLDRAGGIALTLPAATGSGNIYRYHVKTTFSSSATIKVANSSDVMQGTAILFQDSGDTVVGFATAASSDTITMTGTTTGGINGAQGMLQDIATNTWSVSYVSDASGVEATPFSATV